MKKIRKQTKKTKGGDKMSIIESIKYYKKEFKEDKYMYTAKDKKRIYKQIIQEVDGLIKARSILIDLDVNIFEVVGIKRNYKVKDKIIGLSYKQLRNLVVHYINTGRLLKRPYNITNTENLIYKH